MLRAVPLILISFLAIMSCTSNNSKKSDTLNKTIVNNYKIVGYVAGWENTTIKEIDAHKLTHINYAFANIQNGKVVFELENDSINLMHLVNLKQKNPKLKLLYSVGGWIWSKHFSDVALTEETRYVFAKSAVDLMLKYNLDGIDVDWEYPGQIGDNNTFRAEDKQNFTLLLAELRKELLKVENNKKEDYHYLLTIATGANQKYIEHTELDKVAEIVDFINIMTYDFYSGLSKTTGHHAALYSSKYQNKASRDAFNSVMWHLDAGVPAEKLVLGLPFYGRKWEKVNSKNHGLYQPSETIGEIIPYNEIVTNLLSDNSYQRLWDTSACVPYLWNADRQIFISYEDTVSLSYKFQFIKDNKLAGAMFWEYSLDSDQQLLNFIYKNIN